MSTFNQLQINVSVFDAEGGSIPGARVTATPDRGPVVSAEISGQLGQPARITVPDTCKSVKLSAKVGDRTQEATVPSDVGNYNFTFLEIHKSSTPEHEPMNQKTAIILAFIFGVVFVSLILILAVAIPDPTTYQFNVFKTVLALAGAGVAAVIPGILNVRIGAVITAGGALAVFVVLFFYSPASLAVKQISSPPQNSASPTNPTSQLHSEPPAHAAEPPKSPADDWNDPKWETTRGNIRWVFGDQGARATYQANLGGGKFAALLKAQSHNKGSYQSISEYGPERTDRFLKSIGQ